jgi:branched-subunit amino acid ABC-type transport system permease component
MGDVLNALYAIMLFLMIARGLALFFGLMGLINFAHGEFVMLGAHAALWSARRWGFGVALLAPPIFLVACSLVMEAGMI